MLVNSYFVKSVDCTPVAMLYEREAAFFGALFDEYGAGFDGDADNLLAVYHRKAKAALAEGIAAVRAEIEKAFRRGDIICLVGLDGDREYRTFSHMEEWHVYTDDRCVSGHPLAKLAAVESANYTYDRRVPSENMRYAV